MLNKNCIFKSKISKLFPKASPLLQALQFTSQLDLIAFVFVSGHVILKYHGNILDVEEFEFFASNVF